MLRLDRFAFLAFFSSLRLRLRSFFSRFFFRFLSSSDESESEELDDMVGGRARVFSSSGIDGGQKAQGLRRSRAQASAAPEKYILNEVQRSKVAYLKDFLRAAHCSAPRVTQRTAARRESPY
jgi:hypothetical protein